MYSKRRYTFASVFSGGRCVTSSELSGKIRQNQASEGAKSGVLDSHFNSSHVKTQQSNSETKGRTPLQTALQLPLFSASSTAALAPGWTIERVPTSIALGANRFWLVCGDWHYCLQFTGQEADLLAALLTQWDWLNWELDDRGCPACISELHQAIEQLVSVSIGQGVQV